MRKINHYFLLVILTLVFILGSVQPTYSAKLPAQANPSAKPASLLAMSGENAPPNTEAGFLREMTIPGQETAFGFDTIFGQAGDPTNLGNAVFWEGTGPLVVGGQSLGTSLVRFTPNGHPYSARLMTAPENGDHWFRFDRKTPNGGYLLSGLLNTSPQKALVVKLNATLGMEWAVTLSGSIDVFASGGIRTLDGNYLIPVRVENGFELVKLDNTGGLLWQKKLSFTGSEIQTDIYDIFETTYLDDGVPKCGGYLVFGAVQNTMADADWDLILSAVNCDATVVHWTRQIGGTSWDGSFTNFGAVNPEAANLLMTNDSAGFGTQNTNLVLAATSASFKPTDAIVLLPFQVTGTSNVINPPTFQTMRVIDGPSRDRVVGPYGGQLLQWLNTGNIALGFYSMGTTFDNALVIFDPGFNLVSEHLYKSKYLEVPYGMAPWLDGIFMTGFFSHPLLNQVLSYLMKVDLTGDNSNMFFKGVDPDFAYSTDTPTITAKTYTLSEGTLTLAPITMTITEVNPVVLYPTDLSLPLITR